MSKIVGSFSTPTNTSVKKSFYIGFWPIYMWKILVVIVWTWLTLCTFEEIVWAAEILGCLLCKMWRCWYCSWLDVVWKSRQGGDCRSVAQFLVSQEDMTVICDGLRNTGLSFASCSISWKDRSVICLMQYQLILWARDLHVLGFYCCNKPCIYCSFCLHRGWGFWRDLLRGKIERENWEGKQRALGLAVNPLSLRATIWSCNPSPFDSESLDLCCSVDVGFAEPR